MGRRRHLLPPCAAHIVRYSTARRRCGDHGPQGKCDGAGQRCDVPVHHQVPTWTDGKHPIGHNKVMVIDGETTMTGSFNFTAQAENSNAENLLVITGKLNLAAAYEANFAEHLKHSETYEGVKWRPR